MKGLQPKAIRTIQLKVDGTDEVFSDKLKAFTLELVDFKDQPEDYPKSQIEYWMYNLVNMETMTTALPFQAQQPIFSRVGGISELSYMDSDERRRYFYSLNKYRTTQAVMENERYEGEHNKAIEIAKNLLQMNLSLEQIAQATGLSAEDINNL